MIRSLPLTVPSAFTSAGDTLGAARAKSLKPPSTKRSRVTPFSVTTWGLMTSGSPSPV